MELRRLIFQELIPVLIYISDAVFSGLKVLVPVVFGLKIFHIRLVKPDLEKLVKSMCMLVLLGGLFFLTPVCLNTWTSLSSGVEGETDFFIGLVTGSQWYTFFFPAFVFGVLPQLMWFRRFRTVYVLVVLVAAWFVSGFLMEYFSPGKTFILSSSARSPAVPLLVWLKKGVLFIILLCTGYWYAGKRNQAAGNYRP